MTDATISDLRASSRAFVREMGFMSGRFAPADVSHTQCHALLELDRAGLLSQGELAERLLLDKSTTSRLVADLDRRGLVARTRSPADRRRHQLTLTDAGRTAVAQIDDHANGQVTDALALLAPDDVARVVDGMRTYAKALRRRRLGLHLRIRPIQPEDSPGVARIIRSVMPEFGLGGPGTALVDPEVGAMHAEYTSHGALAAYWVVENTRTGELVGGGGFGPLAGTERGTTCELRKMYFLTEARGLGLGYRLLTVILESAREAGYGYCYLETMEHMTHAQRLYRKFGFRELDAPMGCTGHFVCNSQFGLDLSAAPVG